MSRGQFVGGVVNTFAGVTLFPLAEFSGRADKPEIASLAGEAGLELRFSWVSGGFTYYVEKFSFAAQSASGERTDQFSTLRFRLGLKYLR